MHTVGEMVTHTGRSKTRLEKVTLSRQGGVLVGQKGKGGGSVEDKDATPSCCYFSSWTCRGFVGAAARWDWARRQEGGAPDPIGAKTFSCEPVCCRINCGNRSLRISISGVQKIEISFSIVACSRSPLIRVMRVLATSLIKGDFTQ